MKDTRSIKITLDTAKQMYQSQDENIRQLALSAYPELSEPKYPKWEDIEVSGYTVNDFGEIEEVKEGDFMFDEEESKIVWPTKELSEASMALSQLLQLRDAYNKMEKDDIRSCYVIYLDHQFNRLEIGNFREMNMLLGFKTEKLRDAFLENNKELLETAKPLL